MSCGFHRDGSRVRNGCTENRKLRCAFYTGYHSIFERAWWRYRHSGGIFRHDSRHHNSSPARKKKLPFYIAPEKLDEVELTDTCMLSELTNRINALCEENDRKKLTASFINQLLVEKGYLEETVQGEEKIKRVTEKGKAVGIREEERQAKYGRNYYALIHTRESQQMILEELGKYLLQFTPAV